MPRLGLLLVLAALAAVPVALRPTAHARAQQTRAPFTVVEASIRQMQTAMEQGRTSSRAIVEESLRRLALYEDRLNATITVNPRALEEAAARDLERREGRVRGALHGIPIALKDNIHTAGLRTTGGALVFESLVPPYDATLTRHLREAGAVIIAKTVMTELANWVAAAMPTNYSSLAGFAFNPYDPRRDPRQAFADGRPVLSPGGSSSGIGTAASFWAANVGTETSGSILNPASQTMLAAIKPTVGRVSRYGIIPISSDQDTPGPMARSVEDAALLLGILEGATPDPQDPATTACTPPPGRDYTRFLRRGGLLRARIGIPRAYYYEPIAIPGATGQQGGLNASQQAVMAEAIEILRVQGAVVVDPANIPSVLDADTSRNLMLWPICSGPAGAKGRDEGCSVAFKYGMKRGFNAWLVSLGPAAPVKTLAELRAWNLTRERAGALKYGQAQLDISDEMDVERDRARYEADRAKDVALAGTNGIDAALREHRLDALLFPGPLGANIAARPGYPSVIVPFGTVSYGDPRDFPDGFEPKPSPFGVTFTGTACSEPRLVELAYAFEQATERRVAPQLQVDGGW